jgi:hypothetical protein
MHGQQNIKKFKLIRRLFIGGYHLQLQDKETNCEPVINGLTVAVNETLSMQPILEYGALVVKFFNRPASICTSVPY